MLKALPESKLQKWLARGVGLASSPLCFEDAALVIKERSPVFTRHIFPLEYQCPCNAWDKAIEGIAERLSERRARQLGTTYSIQLRVLDPSLYPFSKYDLTQWMSEDLQKRIFTPELDNPDMAISAVLSEYTLYIGMSDPSQNLSSWAGGMRRYARRPDQISRAEFKLLEALEVFDVDISSLPFLRALDLGASPGGWTKILSDLGFSVTAVDPAHLSPALLSCPGVAHVPMTAQKYLRSYQDEFSLLANDMRMDAAESSKMANAFASRLAPGGALIMTLKLPMKKQKSVLDKSMAILRQCYAGLKAKQLFHNRSEATVFGLKPKALTDPGKTPE
jgi:23S rRNA (cytidine2498-2'-O)-methyltransferase